jgi:hypothetical protein
LWFAFGFRFTFGSRLRFAVGFRFRFRRGDRRSVRSGFRLPLGLGLRAWFGRRRGLRFASAGQLAQTDSGPGPRLRDRRLRLRFIIRSR